MRIEGDGDGLDTKRSGTRNDLFDNPLMSAMYAVEVADRGDGRTEVLRNFSELSEDLHRAISKDICNPSWARRMCGGSLALVASWSRSWLMWVKKARFGFSCSTTAMDFSR